MIAEVLVSAISRTELVKSLREIADEIEQENDSVTHWGGHHGKPGSYSVNIRVNETEDNL